MTAGGTDTVAALPPQPISARARSAEPKGWLATIAVAVATIGIVGSGFLAARASLGLPVIPVDLGQGVQVYPPVEWRFLGPSREGTGGEFSNGHGDLVVNLDSRTDEMVVAAGVRAGLVSRGDSATEVEAAPDTHGQNRAARFAFNGTFPGVATVIEGQGFVVAGTHTAVVFIAISGPGGYSAIEDDVAGMISGATIP